MCSVEELMRLLFLASSLITPMPAQNNPVHYTPVCGCECLDISSSDYYMCMADEAKRKEAEHKEYNRRYEEFMRESKRCGVARKER